LHKYYRTLVVLSRILAAHSDSHRNQRRAGFHGFARLLQIITKFFASAHNCDQRAKHP